MELEFWKITQIQEKRTLRQQHGVRPRVKIQIEVDQEPSEQMLKWNRKKKRNFDNNTVLDQENWNRPRANWLNVELKKKKNISTKTKWKKKKSGIYQEPVDQESTDENIGTAESWVSIRTRGSQRETGGQPHQ